MFLFWKWHLIRVREGKEENQLNPNKDTLSHKPIFKIFSSLSLFSQEEKALVEK